MLTLLLFLILLVMVLSNFWVVLDFVGVILATYLILGYGVPYWHGKITLEQAIYNPIAGYTLLTVILVAFHEQIQEVRDKRRIKRSIQEIITKTFSPTPSIKTEKKKLTSDLLEKEELVKEGWANKTGLIWSIGGKLLLTNMRVLFLSHRFEPKRGSMVVDLKDILTVSKGTTFIIFFPIPIPNCIKIRMRDGKTKKFAVRKRKKWIEAISAQITAV